MRASLGKAARDRGAVFEVNRITDKWLSVFSNVVGWRWKSDNGAGDSGSGHLPGDQFEEMTRATE